MKKLIIPALCLACVSILAGCANQSAEQTMTTLNNQLDRVHNIVKSTSVDEISAVSPSITLESDQPYNSIQHLRAISNENMLREEEIRQKILNSTTLLKSQKTSDLKLGNKNLKALKETANNLSKYCSLLNKTKYEVKNTVNKIKKNLKISNMNIEEATSNYISLNGSMNERYAYMKNIYDNLEQTCIILNCDSTSFENCENCKEKIISTNPDETEHDSKENTNQGEFKIIKNIDSYNPAENNFEESPENNIPPRNSQTEFQNIPDRVNQRFPIAATPYPQNHHYPNINQHPFGNENFYVYDRINPGRNTDTYYSFNHNIDTYRFNPSFYNNYYNY